MSDEEISIASPSIAQPMHILKTVEMKVTLSDETLKELFAGIVPANFARRLERERDEAREELARVRKELVAANRGAETNAKVNQGLCARLAEAERERDEARRVNEWTEEFERLLGELNAAREEVSALKAKLDSVSQMNQHADKSSVGDSTYVLTQQPCQRASRVGMETDWTATGYREGMSAALHSGGTRGAKWHAERKGIQGEAADNYISGFNAALDEYEQEEAK